MHLVYFPHQVVEYLECQTFGRFVSSPCPYGSEHHPQVGPCFNSGIVGIVDVQFCEVSQGAYIALFSTFEYFDIIAKCFVGSQMCFLNKKSKKSQPSFKRKTYKIVYFLFYLYIINFVSFNSPSRIAPVYKQAITPDY